MNFLKVIDAVCSDLDTAGVRYALIGGFAMALRGVQRATVDLDFILMLQDLDKADAIFRRAGYERVFKSENVSHYFSRDLGLGRIRDWADIQQVLESASESYQSIDWELLSDYLALFNLSNQLGKMKGWYGTLK